MPESTSQNAPDPARYVVKVASIDPQVPGRCVRCLGEPSSRRRLSFRRSDGTVERVAVVYWPYCAPCRQTLAHLESRHRLLGVFGLLQMLVVIYAVGAALGYYPMWWPSLGLLAAAFAVFLYYARQAKRLWAYEWARIDDVYKGGVGAAYSFRNPAYAELFAAANVSAAAGAGAS